ncbi:MAG: ATP-binding cassette domain-containing protein [Desulfobacter sp.]|nr:MAG: ATP-binding cassette domain-containing protein [Desulfobacter sp.]
MKIKNCKTEGISIPRFEAGPGQAWCIFGANRSGIDAFFRILAGEAAADDLGPDTDIVRPANCGVFSFAGQQALFETELKKDDTDFMDRLDPGTPARKFLNRPETHQDLIRAFAMDHVMDHGFRQLSTGQSRKLMLLARITRGADCLVIQAPYEGLDRAGCRELDLALGLCRDRGIRIIITVHNPGDIPLWATHIAVVDKGRLALAGARNRVMDKIAAIEGTADFKAGIRDLEGKKSKEEKAELVRLENGTAGYQGRIVFTGVNLDIRTGDHTLISGPNGCGKSTLLQVITGDHPACYRNRLWIFGTRRGTGESIWDLKKKMGIVSADLHRNYIVPGSVLDCVLSGLYDSIGLYTAPTEEDRKKALAWLDRISLSHKAGTPLRTLSYADQRLVLIARALIKLPPLLILDEPTQGLDQANREALLDFLEAVAGERLSTILYVSHREDEYRNFFATHLKLDRPGRQADQA